MSAPSFVYGLIWNKWTQGSAFLFISGYMFSLGGWPLTKFIARTAYGWGGEVAGSGFFGHQGRAIAALAKTTPGQIAVGGVVGYGVGLGVGYVVADQLYGKEGADLFLDVMTPGGDVGILTKEAWTEVIGPSVFEQSAISMKRKSKQSLKAKAKEAATEFVLGPFWGPAYGFFRT